MGTSGGLLLAPGTGKQCPVWQPFGHRQTGRAVSQSELSVGLKTQMKPGKRRTLKAVYGTYRQRFVMDENSFGVVGSARRGRVPVDFILLAVRFCTHPEDGSWDVRGWIAAFKREIISGLLPVIGRLVA